MQKPQNDLSGQEHFQVQRLDVKKRLHLLSYMHMQRQKISRLITVTEMKILPPSTSLCICY